MVLMSFNSSPASTMGLKSTTSMMRWPSRRSQYLGLFSRPAYFSKGCGVCKRAWLGFIRLSSDSDANLRPKVEHFSNLFSENCLSYFFDLSGLERMPGKYSTLRSDIWRLVFCPSTDGYCVTCWWWDVTFNTQAKKKLSFPLCVLTAMR